MNGDKSGDKLKNMKRLKQSHLIHIWEEYEFYLNVPKLQRDQQTLYILLLL